MKTQVTVKKPTINQHYILNNLNRFNVVRCGRRFGKTELCKMILRKHFKYGLPLSWISTNYKQLEPVYNDFIKTFYSIIKKTDRQLKKIYLINDLLIDFWSFENIESVRGSKYKHIILDESAKEKKLKFFYDSILRATLLDYKGGVTFASTPFGYNDFKDFDERSKTKKDWNSFKYSSYDNEKLDKDEIDELVTELPGNIVQQEIYAEYIDISGNLIKKEYLKYYSEQDIQLEQLDIYTGVDLAISKKETADYTAITTIGKHKETSNIYVLDYINARLNFKETINAIMQVNSKYRPDLIGVESVAYQSALTDTLISETTLPIEKITPKRDKVTRFLPVQAKLENGLIYIKSDMKELENQLLTFPDSENDDIIDSMTYAILLTMSKQTQILLF